MQDEDKVKKIVPQERIDAWEVVSNLLQLFIRNVGSLYAELCYRGCEPTLSITFIPPRRYEVVVTFPVTRGLDEIALNAFINLTEIFKCKLEVVPKPDETLCVLYYGFEGIEKEFNEEPELEGQDELAAPGDDDSNDNAVELETPAEEDTDPGNSS